LDNADVVALGLLLCNIILLIAILVRRDLVRERQGKLLLLVAAFVLPGVSVLAAAGVTMKKSRNVSFCMSCHEMGPYGESLEIDDEEVIPAVHFQNNLVERGAACYECHTDYTMYGTAKAKMAGIQHVWVHYFGTPPEKIELYQPYDVGICLHCHDGGRRFEEARVHTRSGRLEKIKSGEKSCLSSGCHDTVHHYGDDEDEEEEDDA